MIWSHLYSDCNRTSSSLKLWDLVSARIQRWRTGGGSETWRGGNRSRNWGTWPKHLGHHYLELTIILFTQLLWFGMHCVENWSQRETEVGTGGCGENTRQYFVWYLWKNVFHFLCVGCSHRDCDRFYHVHVCWLGNPRTSSKYKSKCA